jgi:hypothetical protein
VDDPAGTAPRRSPRRPDRRTALGIAVAVVGWVLVVAGSDPTIDVSEPFSGWVTAQDARSYYGFDYADIYAGRDDWGTIGAYPYAPAFAQALWPLNQLPWPAFVGAWTAILIGAVWYLTGPRLFLLGLAVGAMEIAGGNVHLLLAAAIVAGFRHPGAWALPLLTKIAPGVGLLWFAIRREWRKLGLAVSATIAIVAVSFAVQPSAWFDWVALLAANLGKGGTWAAVPIPLVARAPLGLALIVWGAARNQRWTVPIGVMLCLPALWYGALSMVLAVIPLTTPEERRRAWNRVRGAVGRLGARTHGPGAGR